MVVVVVDKGPLSGQVLGKESNYNRSSEMRCPFPVSRQHKCSLPSANQMRRNKSSLKFPLLPLGAKCHDCHYLLHTTGSNCSEAISFEPGHGYYSEIGLPPSIQEFLMRRFMLLFIEKKIGNRPYPNVYSTSYFQ